MERKELKLDRVDVDAAGEFEGHASVFDVVDFQNDVVIRGAFDGGLDRFMKRGFIGWHHDMSVPIAYPTAAREDARGLFVAARFHTTPDGQRARTIAAERVSAGKTMGLSIGYTVRPGGARKRADGVRELRDLELHEVSLVMIPANDLAGITAVKAHTTTWTDVDRHALRERARTVMARAESNVLRAEHRRLTRQLDDLDAADFYEVIPSHVASATRATVASVLTKACGDLGIPVPRLRYFRPARPGDRAGEEAMARRHGAPMPIAESFRGRKDLGGQAIAARGEVWIRTDLDPDALVYVVAHEARHIAQGSAAFGRDASAWAERDAREYGAKFRADLGTTTRPDNDVPACDRGSGPAALDDAARERAGLYLRMGRIRAHYQ